MIRKRKIIKCNYSKEMYLKEFKVGQKDLESAKMSFKNKNYKWTTIQAYYAIFHAVRALVFKSGYREESHFALKHIFEELYIKNDKLPISTYNCLERGMRLREMADYKETYSKEGAEDITISVSSALEEIEKLIS